MVAKEVIINPSSIFRIASKATLHRAFVSVFFGLFNFLFFFEFFWISFSYGFRSRAWIRTAPCKLCSLQSLLRRTLHCGWHDPAPPESNFGSGSQNPSFWNVCIDGRSDAHGAQAGRDPISILIYTLRRSLRELRN